MTKAIERARARVTKIKAEIEALEGQQPKRSEAEAVLHVALCRAADEGAAIAGQHLREAVFADTARDMRGALGAMLSARAGETVNLLPVLAYIVGPEVIFETLKFHLRDLPDDVPTKAQRAKRLDDLRAELETAEVDEERAIRAAEQAGEEVIRRADARLDIVLAASLD